MLRNWTNPDWPPWISFEVNSLKKRKKERPKKVAPQNYNDWRTVVALHSTIPTLKASTSGLSWAGSRRSSNPACVSLASVERTSGYTVCEPLPILNDTDLCVLWLTACVPHPVQLFRSVNMDTTFACCDDVHIQILRTEQTDIGSLYRDHFRHRTITFHKSEWMPEV